MNASETLLRPLRQIPDCALCSSMGGRLIWQNATLRVVLIDDADLPGYTRVILKEHVAEMTELPDTLRHDIMNVALTVEQVQRTVLNPDKVNLASLGNMTPHVHWHVIPRWRDDPWFPEAIWAPRRNDPPAAGTTLNRPSAAALDDYVNALASTLHPQFGAP